MPEHVRKLRASAKTKAREKSRKEWKERNEKPPVR